MNLVVAATILATARSMSAAAEAISPAAAWRPG
jgi:hypothetical protein